MKPSYRGHDNETAAWVAKSNDGTEPGIVVILGVATPRKAQNAAVESVEQTHKSPESFGFALRER